jgi:hypothetical protein
VAIRTNSISGGFAPLTDPVFTGSPKAPTAATDTATTQVATTAFADERASRYPEYTSQTANFDVAVAMIGRMVPVTPGASGTTVTGTIRLAANVAYPPNAVVGVYRNGVGTVTVAGEAGVLLITEGPTGNTNGSGNTGPFTVRAVAGEIHLRRRGTTNTWVATGAIA